MARRRPTFPRLEAQYHGRWGVSRPSSGWDRVYHPRDDHRATLPDPGMGVGMGWLVCVVGCEWSRLGAACGAVFMGQRLRLCVVENVRAIRTARLHRLPDFHLRPIDVMVYHGPRGRPRLEGGFLLRCLQQLSRPDLATQRCGGRHNWYTRGTSIPVLSY